MSGWADTAIAVVLLIAATARAAEVTSTQSDPARRWLVATLAALGIGTLLQAMLAVGAGWSPLQRGMVMWLSDVATMIAAACMVGVVAPDREHDPHTSRLCAHAMAVAAVALMMAAQIQVAAAASPSTTDQHTDPLHYLLPYLSYLLLALVGTVHGLLQQPPRLSRLPKPAITAAIIGGAIAGIVGAAAQRLSAAADPPLLFAAPRVTHVGVILEVSGHVVLIAGLAATPILRARRAFRRSRQYRALEPLWRLVSDAALHVGHRSQASAASVVPGGRVDLLYGRVIEICDASRALTPYALSSDPLGLEQGHVARPEPATAAALLKHAILVSRDRHPPSCKVPIRASEPDRKTIEDLAAWLIAVGAILTDIDYAAGTHATDPQR